MLTGAVSTLQDKLQIGFQRADEALLKTIELLALKNTPGAQDCLYQLRSARTESTTAFNIKMNELDSTLKKELNRLEKCKENRDQISCQIIDTYIDEQKKNHTSDVEMQTVENFIQNFKVLCTLFEKTILKSCSKADLDPIEVTLIHWVAFGLEKLSAVSFNMVTYTGHWLNQNALKQTPSRLESMLMYLTQKAHIYAKIINAFFNINEYLANLQIIETQYKETIGTRNIAQPTPEDGSSSSPSSLFSSQNFMSVLSSGGQKSLEILSNVVADASLSNDTLFPYLRKKCKHLFVTKLLSEIRLFNHLFSSIEKTHAHHFDSLLSITTLFAEDILNEVELPL